MSDLQIAFEFKKSESLQQWEADLVNLGTLGRHVQFHIGDKIIEGEDEGYITRGVYDRVMELTGIEKLSLKQYVHVCKSVKRLTRVNDLEYSHHRLVAPFESDKQEYFLNEAVENHWSVSNLREAIKLDAKDKSIINEIDDLRILQQDSNMYYRSASYLDNRFGDKIIDLENDEVYYVLTTLERFFHRKTMMEFSLREYADLQTFPNDFKFIGTYSEIKKHIGNAVAPMMGEYITSELTGKTMGDLFAGCGGLTCGAHQNGLESKWAIEWEEIAAMTYKLNFPDTKVLNTNIKTVNLELLDNVDIILGGPPCQGFSIAGKRAIDDPRNELYKEFVRVINYMKPNEFIMENVKEIQEIKDQVIEDFESIGYNVETKLVRGPDIGMKQNRIRFFFIGRKNGWVV
jgi:DNA (cytosine-5)-methyltransferase 1